MNVRQRLFRLLPLHIFLLSSFSMTLNALSFEKVSQNLYAGVARAPSGKTFYLAMEQVEASTLPHWEAYAQLTGRFANWKNGPFYLSAKSSENPPVFDNIAHADFGFSKEEYDLFVKELRAANAFMKNRVQAIARLDGGTNGFLERLKPGVWVVYASKTPVKQTFNFDNATLSKPLEKITFKELTSAFGNLIMSMTVSEFKSTPFTEHRGIFRSIFDFVDPKKTYGGIALILHGFAAEVAHHVFEEKKYVEVDPTPFMSKLLAKNIGPDDMFMGTSKQAAFNSSYRPIIHESGDAVAIAQEGVDLKQYPHDLPKDKVFYKKRGEDGLIVLYNTHLIKIASLSKFYLETLVTSD